MRCPYCGKEISDSAKFCTGCGRKLPIEMEEPPAPAKKSRTTLVIIVLAAACALAVLAAVFLWLRYAWELKADSASEPAFEAYYQEFSDGDVRVENQVCFVDSQLLLTAADGVSQAQVEKLVKEEDGAIVGYLSISNDYQIEFPKGKTYEELNAIVNQWQSDNRVEAVSLNYVSPIDGESVTYTGDPWIDAENPEDTSGSQWSEASPGGNNWWAEAIMMPSVWNMDTEFQTVKVGIYDSMFDTSSEDLDDVFAMVWNNPVDADGHCFVPTLYTNAYSNVLLGVSDKIDSMYYHGTHVAGIIAGEAENGFGIAGVAQNAELYGFAWEAEPTDTSDVSRWGTVFEIKYGIALMLNEEVKVINVSMGFPEMLVAAQKGEQAALDVLDIYSSSLEQFLAKCLDSGYDFLIVKSAGNESGKKWVKDSNSLSGYKDSGLLDNSTYDAKYDFLGAIEDSEVKAHILIVGAAENHTDYYTTASFSAVGNRVDVYAPGVEILSDLPTNITGMKHGTSMAAPIVSGIAALVWGANPDLSAAQVASIIRASSSVSMFDADSHSLLFREFVECIPIVNAYFAVRLALNTSGEGIDAAGTAGIITGMVYFTGANGSLTALNDAVVTVIDSDGNTVETAVTSNFSGYTFILPAGTYTLTAELVGYETASKEVSVAASDVLDVDFELQFESKAVADYVEFTSHIEDSMEYGELIGYAEDGTIIWSVTTDKYECTELDRVLEIGEHNGAFYYVENGIIKCLKTSDGTIIWESNDSTGALACMTFDDAGNLYVCGFYGPDFFAVAPDGKTLAWIESFDEAYYWPYEMTYTGSAIEITMDGTPTGKPERITVTLPDYRVVLPEVASSTETVPTALSDEMLNDLKTELGIPEELEVEAVQHQPYYWEAAERYAMTVEFYHNGECVAGATVDPKTSDLLRNIHIYSGG